MPLPFLADWPSCEIELLRIAGAAAGHAAHRPALQDAAASTGSWLAHAGLPLPPLKAESVAIFHGRRRHEPGRSPHRRRNLLTGEWVLVSPHRAKRPWQGEAHAASAARPPRTILLATSAPATSAPRVRPTRTMPATFVFKNDFAALLHEGGGAGHAQGSSVTKPATGEAQVICFAPDHAATLARLAIAGIARWSIAWCDLSAELGAQLAACAAVREQGRDDGRLQPASARAGLGERLRARAARRKRPAPARWLAAKAPCCSMTWSPPKSAAASAWLRPTPIGWQWCRTGRPGRSKRC